MTTPPRIIPEGPDADARRTLVRQLQAAIAALCSAETPLHASGWERVLDNLSAGTRLARHETVKARAR